MYPVHDVDAILLLSLAVAAKRRPADLIEIATAIDMAQETIPSATKLSDAFARVSAYGLIVEIDGQKMMESQRKKDDNAKHIYRLKEHLADYHLVGEHVTLYIQPEVIKAAVDAHLAAKKPGIRNMLMPKSKAEIALKKQPFNPFYSRKRKD
jgi:hypothetical protein